MKRAVLIAAVLGAVAVVAIGARSLMPAGPLAQPIQALTASMNPLELHLKADMKSLPVTRVSEPF